MPNLSPAAIELIGAVLNGDKVERFVGNTEVTRVQSMWEDVDMDEAVAGIAQATPGELTNLWRLKKTFVTKEEALNALQTLTFGHYPTSVLGEAARTLNLFINQS